MFPASISPPSVHVLIGFHPTDVVPKKPEGTKGSVVSYFEKVFSFNTYVSLYYYFMALLQSLGKTPT